MTHNQLIAELVKADIVQFGQFTLKSGQTTDIYFNLKALGSHPKVLNRVAQELVSRIVSNDNIVVACIPMGGIPITTAVSLQTNIPLVLIREEKKTYGLQNLIEGEWQGKSCVLIEDVVTTGQSVINTLELLRAEGMTVCQIIVVLDREVGGMDRIRTVVGDCPVECLLKSSDMTKLVSPPMRLNDRNKAVIGWALEKPSNLIVSLDMTDPKLLLQTIWKIAEYVLGFKLCFGKLDFGSDSNARSAFVRELHELRMIWEFMVIDDRLYGPTPGSLPSDYYCVLSHYDTLVHAVTVRTTDGLGMIRDLDRADKLGLLLDQTTSTTDPTTSTTDPTTSIETSKIANSCQNLLGLISSEHIDGHLIWTQNIHLNVTEDMDGQYYTPQQAGERGTDFFIVGRDIWKHENPIGQASKYHAACWNSWKRLNNGVLAECMS